MRIDDRDLTGASPAKSGRTYGTQKPNHGQSVQTETATTGQVGDRVELSSTLETLSRALSASGSERSSRIQALAAQYQSGNYYPDSASTARSMISEALLAESP